MMKAITIATLAVFALTATTTADEEVVPCLYQDWKVTCHDECVKSGPNIQFNRCYNYNEADLMCKCNDKDLTNEIIDIFKTNPSNNSTTTPSKKPTDPKKTEQGTDPASTVTIPSTAETPKNGDEPANADANKSTNADANKSTNADANKSTTADADESTNADANKSTTADADESTTSDADESPKIDTSKSTASEPKSGVVSPPSSGNACEHGAWDCIDNVAKVCSNNVWVTIGCPTSTKCKKSGKSVVCAI